MTQKIFDSVIKSVEKAARGTPAKNTTPEPVMKAIERILDEESAWIARPNPEVTKRVALRAVVAAQRVMTDLALFDAREAMVEETIAPEKTAQVLEELQGMASNGAFTKEARDLFATAAGLIERTIMTDYNVADPQSSATDGLVDRFAMALKEKLNAAAQKYGYSDDWMKDDWCGELIAKLLNHVQKGDPRDVAAYCAFAWHHGWSITPSQYYEPRTVARIARELGLLAMMQSDATVREGVDKAISHVKNLGEA